MRHRRSDGSTSPAVPVLTRKIRRAAEAEARRDGEGSTLAAPTSYQERLQAECAHLIHVDLEARQALFTSIASSESRNEVERQRLERLQREKATELKRAQSKLDATQRPHWTGRLPEYWKWVLLGILGGFEWIMVRTALGPLSLDDWIKNFLAVLLGIVPVIAIEVSGGQLLEVFRWHGERIEKRRGWQFAAALIASLGAAIATFLVLLGIVRGKGFIYGGTFANVPHSYSISFAAGLAVLQAVALGAAVALTREHAAGDEWRHRSDHVDRLAEVIAAAEEHEAALEREQAELSAERATFREISEQHHLALLRHFAAIDACYRMVLCRIKPASEASLQAAWAAWEPRFLQTLRPAYENFENFHERDEPRGTEFPPGTPSRVEAASRGTTGAAEADALAPESPERSR